jgi:hypothetical protein
LGLRRRPVKTHARLAKDELSVSIDHLVQAANHAAGGVGATVGPRIDAARARVAPTADLVRSATAAGLGTTAAALAPLAVAAKDGARKAKDQNAKAVRKVLRKPEPVASRTWPRLATLLVAGAAVGAAAAFVLRRRRQQQHWDEYDPSRPLDSPADAARDTLHRATDSVTTTAEELATKASTAVDSAKTRLSSGGSGTTESTTTVVTPATPATGVNTPMPGTGIGSPVSGLDSSSNNRHGG